ncbi:hypothetical protein ACFY30_21275 [Streptomyces sp. NPDC000345]|uniref:hypothetical protein n=1 Tax=Streptomyces sp. NPDC000345 TaxID=3364537 RepID=UPI00369BF035
MDGVRSVPPSGRDRAAIRAGGLRRLRRAPARAAVERRVGAAAAARNPDTRCWRRAGEWVTNEKRLLERAGLRGVDELVGLLGSAESGELVTVVERAESLLAECVRAASEKHGAE